MLPFFAVRKRLILITRILIIISTITILFFLLIDLPMKIHPNDDNRLKEKIVIAITICGNQSLFQGLNAIKSMLIFSNANLHLIIMTDSQPILQPKVIFFVLKFKFKLNLI